MSLKDLYQKLEVFSNFENEDNLIPFIETVEKIVSYQDPICFPILLKYFEDDTDYSWIMQSMIHALESFSDEIYTREIMKAIPYLLKNSPNWLLTIAYRILNHEESLKCFKFYIHTIPQDSILELLNLVSKESEHHKDLCKTLKNLINQDR